MRRAFWIASVLAVGAGCVRGPAVQTHSALALRRVVIYRNGVGYFERRGSVSQDSVEFRVRQSEVGDFLATLAVMERGGSSVRSAAFPLPADSAQGGPVQRPNDRRTVRLQLDGRQHDLTVGYMVETPIWRPSYRLVYGQSGAGGAGGTGSSASTGGNVQVQAWGIVQNISGEDWTGVRLSLVSGSPVSFRSELAEPVLTERPLVTDRGEVLEVVPRSDTTIAQDESGANAAPGMPVATAAPPAPMAGAQATGSSASARGGLGLGRGRMGGGGGGGGSAASSGYMARMSANRMYERRARRANTRGDGDDLDDLTDGADRQQAAAEANVQREMLRPRSIASLAAVAVQGGTTRYDLPAPVTVPDHSATMVLLAARDVPGERVYLFAPDGAVADSASHPFQVARFTNRTGALLERGPVAIFESGAFLGQGMLDPLPDGASTTIPFALERAVAVESSSTASVDGARLLRLLRGEITIERYRVNRTMYRVRNGLEQVARVVLRHALGGDMRIHEPPPGTEQANGAALVPVSVNGHGRADIELQTRVPFSMATEWTDEMTALAIEAYLRDGHPAADVATTLRQALEHRAAIVTLTEERSNLIRRRDDLENNSEETRQNLEAIRRNPGAADLRARLTTRLSQISTQIDQATRRIVELDTQIGERRVRLLEAVRTLDINTATPASNARPAGSPASGVR